jgi:GTP 3',8-cyclase
MPGTPVDTLGRPIRDLRVSVTDRCNFRCRYCMPREIFGSDYPFLPRGELLTFEEITRLADLLTGLGVRKVRLTGGEPLLRHNLERLVAMLAALPGIDDLTMTTNGSLLAKHATALAAAGLHRVTVSLDSLDDATFRAGNDSPVPVAQVLEGIEAAAAAGLTPVKVNVVVRRGVNDHEVAALARRFKGTGQIVRFIEYMDVGHSNGWRLEQVVPAAEVVAAVNVEMPLEAVPANYPGEVAPRRLRRDRRGRLGDPPLLRRLHSCPPLGRRQDLHLPVRHLGPRPARPAARRRLRRGDHCGPRRHLDGPGRPLLRSALRRHHRPAQGGDVLHRRLGRRRGPSRSAGITFSPG